MRAELEAQRMAASSLPVSTQSQDPQEPVNSLPQPQQHPSQQQTPLTTGQQRQSTLQQQVMPIAQTVQPPQYQPTQGIGTLIPTTLQGLGYKYIASALYIYHVIVDFFMLLA